MLPDFIRYFADTSNTPLGTIALGYCKSLCRIAPVRVVSMTGGLDGAWKGFDELTLTPMVGRYVNCVCTHPQHWAYTQTVPTSDRAFSALEHHVIDGKKADEVLTGQVELYTVGVRNVLLLATKHLTEQHLVIAKKYESIVYGVDHNAVRAAVLGEGTP